MELTLLIRYRSVRDFKGVCRLPTWPTHPSWMHAFVRHADYKLAIGLLISQEGGPLVHFNMWTYTGTKVILNKFWTDLSTFVCMHECNFSKQIMYKYWIVPINPEPMQWPYTSANYRTGSNQVCSEPTDLCLQAHLRINMHGGALQGCLP